MIWDFYLWYPRNNVQSVYVYIFKGVPKCLLKALSVQPLSVNNDDQEEDCGFLTAQCKKAKLVKLIFQIITFY